MLKLGEKGAIPQRDKTTYAIAPHIPCGVVSPELLRKLADIAEKYEAQAMKITGATRIAIVGLKEEDIDKVWEELGMDKVEINAHQLRPSLVLGNGPDCPAGHGPLHKKGQGDDGDHRNHEGKDPVRSNPDVEDFDGRDVIVTRDAPEVWA